LNQTRDNFEVIVVNDGSSDNSKSVLTQFKKNYSHLKIVEISNSRDYHGHKKNALTLGIEEAKYDHLLFTDADCKPASEHWISTMTSRFTETRKIILGYGAYQKKANSILNKLIRYETLLTAIQYFSYANLGIPYMGVGRNLAYSKKLFIESYGFKNHWTVRSGDDDLFINQAATKNNIDICYSPNAFTISKAKETWSTFKHQKRRHITTASYYKTYHKFFLGTFYMSQFFFWILAIILLTFSFNWLIVTILVLIRLIIQYIVFGISAKKLDEKDLLLTIPFLDLILVFFQFEIFLNNLISKPKTW
jgi:cellulose synthase/poly-beta-1,6-N-acetylglucosamine synthase-like glycosyltransferase